MASTAKVGKPGQLISVNGTHVREAVIRAVADDGTVTVNMVSGMLYVAEDELPPDPPPNLYFQAVDYTT